MIHTQRRNAAACEGLTQQSFRRLITASESQKSREVGGRRRMNGLRRLQGANDGGLGVFDRALAVTQPLAMVA